MHRQIALSRRVIAVLTAYIFALTACGTPMKMLDEPLPWIGESEKPLNVAILVFHGIDTLAWAGPVEVLTHAHGSFNIYPVAPLMKASDGGTYQITPKYTFANMPEANILIVAGGNIAVLTQEPEIMDWIKATSRQADITMSVCNAATVLAEGSMLDGLKATTHGDCIPRLKRLASENNFTVVEGRRFVDNGKIITTAGIASGIDGTFHLIARLKGLATARMAASMMEYNWQPDNTEQYHQQFGRSALGEKR